MKERLSALITTAVLGAALLAHAQAGAQSQPYPNRPIEIVVPWSAGSSVDTVARLLGSELATAMKATVTVSNKAGASGLIGTQPVVRAAPDGYTLTISSSATHSSARSLIPNLPYDELKDFTHIARLVQVPYMLVINAELPVKTLAEFVEYARANPGKLNAAYGTPTSQVMAATFEREAGIKAVGVAFKSQPPAVIDLVGGRVDYLFAGIDQSATYVKAGKLRALAVTSAQRLVQVPDVPTLAESGFPGFDLAGWAGLSGPAGMTREVVELLSLQTQKALAKPEIAEQLHRAGFEIAPKETPQQFERYVATQREIWTKRVRDAGIAIN